MPGFKIQTGMKGEDKMRKYGKNGQLKSIVCNQCGKSLAVRDGIVREGAVLVNHAWDYFSEKDGEDTKRSFAVLTYSILS